MQKLEKCNICPHSCGVNRLEGKLGRCRASDKIKIALVSLHNFEEPCISGNNGSGTIFFSNCNLNCVFCQNYEISQLGNGKEITIEKLADIFLEQQNNNAENINLVTPTMYIYQIIEAIKIARNKGLHIPIIYNSNGYECVDTLKDLNGYIDIYLPDLKYKNDEIAYKYSKIKNYFKNATQAIEEMYKQVGNPILDENGIMKKGLMIRHLILPNNIQDSKDILKWINGNIDKKVFISIMAQYFPTHKAKEFSEINRKLTKEEYDEIENYLYSLDLVNGYIQDLGDNEEEYVPDFKSWYDEN